MAMANPALNVTKIGGEHSGQTLLAEHHSNELFVAIVGPAGAGSGTAAKRIEAFFEGRLRVRSCDN